MPRFVLIMFLTMNGPKKQIIYWKGNFLRPMLFSAVRRLYSFKLVNYRDKIEFFSGCVTHGNSYQHSGFEDYFHMWCIFSILD